MAQVNISVIESPLANAGAPANVGTLFVAGLTDQGPPSSGPAYVLCRQLTDYTNAFGARSSASSVLYDTLDEFYSDGGTQAYVTRVTDSSATKASLTLQDSGPHPTVTVTAQTAGVDGNAIYVLVTVASSQVTITLQDSAGDVLETHGPFSTQAAILADNTSALVKFAQASGSGFTSNLPVASAAAAMTGGANANDLTDASHVSALYNFPKSLGPGTVILPGKTSATAAQGLFNHAALNNRFAVVDQADASTSASVVSSAVALAIPTAQQKCGIVVQGSLVLPTLSSITGLANRTVPGSAAVAALRAQVANTPNNNRAPAGINWPLQRPLGFTTAFGVGTGLAGQVIWNEGDVQAMTSGGVCFFASMFGTNCLDEFVTPSTTDVIFNQANAWTEVMALVADCQQIGLQFQFAPIDQIALNALHSALATVVQAHWVAEALYGDTADDAASIQTGSPINTAATAQLGQLNAALAVKITKYADVVSFTINVLSLTQAEGLST